MAEKTDRMGLAAINIEPSSLMVAAGLVGILMVMILPLPTLMLDLLLSLGITMSLVILLMSMYNTNPLDFSAFPALLLLTTLYRLSLNIASTRLILLHGHEGPGAVGRVIQSFGNFVVGGNYAVGLIIFLIMVLINFIVITKGSGRIAEVAARFTLDAMPGKQMAIDADLNAGLINEEMAKKRRAEIRPAIRVLRRHGRCQQVCPRRGGGQHRHHGHQYHGRTFHRHLSAENGHRPGRRNLYPADHR